MRDDQAVSDLHCGRKSTTQTTIVDNPARADLEFAWAAHLLSAERLGKAVAAAVVDGGLSWEVVGDVVGLSRRLAGDRYGSWVAGLQVGRALDSMPEPTTVGELFGNLRAAGGRA